MNAVQAQPAPLKRGSGSPEVTAHAFGEGLVGILHAEVDSPRREIAVILLNAGMVHRIGPHRGSVELARAVAGAGFPVFRYDQSGLGDSPVSRQVSAERRHEELKAAMELVNARTGATRFVVGGICSAADDAFHLATIEPRVHGVLLLDGLAYRTPGYWLRHLPPRVFNPVKLWNWWRSRSHAQPGMENFRDWPSRQDAIAAVKGMVSRDVRMLFVFTGGAYRYFNHAGQLPTALGGAIESRQVSSEYWPDCDHTFYLKRDRSRLQQRVISWLSQEYASPKAASRS